MAQPDLGIDISNRNVYILDEIGGLLTSSDQNATTVSVTANLLTAMNGAVGQSSSITDSFMDLAIPLDTETSHYIIYVVDNQSTINALTGQVMMIILRSLAMGLIICVILAFILAQIMITPLQALTKGTRQVAAGDFSQKLEVTSRDEIGVLTRNFNNMSQVLQNTLSEVESERDKLSTLFLHMTDGVVAFGPNGMVIQYNPASVQMLGRTLDATVTFQELFSQEASFEELLALQRPQYLEAQKRAGSRELELFMTPFAAEQTPYGALVVIHDVTEQRKNEQMRREFVANVSHELRTPLTNIRSYAETIMDSGDEMPPALRGNFLGVIVSEADRMTRIVQDLLTLSKFDYGKMEMNIARFPFARPSPGSMRQWFSTPRITVIS